MSGDYGLWWHKEDHRFFIMLISNTRNFSYFSASGNLDFSVEERTRAFEQMPNGHFLVAPEGFNEWGQE